MVRDLALLSTGIMVSIAAFFMNASLTANYHNDLSFAPESETVSTAPAMSKNFFRPGSGVDSRFNASF